MTRVTQLQQRFVTTIPASMEEGVLYISLEYATMIHLCACGCGREVITPLSPQDWRMTFDGETVSVTPSVGNWALPCRSHYIIHQGRIQWAGDWTDERIRIGRENDLKRKRAAAVPEVSNVFVSAEVPSVESAKPGILAHLLRWLKRGH